jgi:16S rRNA (cytidine1402-2'-O)-methyltransferase
VVAVPGASAIISALVASGLPTESFRFAGFLPARSGERRSALEGLRDASETLVFYEAPHRILEMLADLQKTFGPERRMVLARELTKVHEEFLRGTTGEVAAEVTKRGAIKGEMTVILAGKPPGEGVAPAKRNLAGRVRQLMATESLDEKAALKQTAREFGLSKSEAYREWQRNKKDRVIGPSGDRAK